MKLTNILKNKKGFTLVETMITLVIIAIVGGFATGSLISYQKLTRFNENNNKAETVFSATQLTLTRMNGQTELLNLYHQLAVEVGDGEVNGDGTIGKLNGITLLEDAGATPIDQNKENFYIIFEKGEEETIPVKAQLRDKIQSTMQDATVVANSTFAIEIEPLGGVVLNVLYSNNANHFIYGNSQEASTIDIAFRQYAQRKENGLGYYSAGKSKSDLKAIEDNIKSATLVNGNTLDLVWEMKIAPTYLLKDQTFQVELMSEDNKPLALVTFKGLEKTDKIQNPIVKGDLYLPVDGKLPIVPTYQDVKFRAYVEANDTNNYHLTLDAVDLGKLPEEINSATINTFFGIGRLGIGDTKIKATIRTMDTTGQLPTGKIKSTGYEETLFATMEDEIDSTFSIGNFRHLNNIRYVEKEEIGSNPATEHQYIIQNELQWGGTDGIVDRCDVYRQGVLVIPTTTMTNAKLWELPLHHSDPKTKTLDQYGFTPLPFINSGSSLKGIEKNTKIKNLILANPQDDKSTSYGLIGENKGELKNLDIDSALVHIKDNKAETNLNIGVLTGHNTGTISNCVLGNSLEDSEHTNIEAEAQTIGEKTYKDSHLGGLVGLNGENGKITQCTTNKNVSILTTTIEDGVGGVIGKSQSTQKFETLINHGKVQGVSKVGGIAGIMEKPDDLTKLENHGEITGSESQVGGLIGVVTEGKKINTPKNTGQVTANKLDAGGIVGYYTGIGMMTDGENSGNITALEGNGGGFSGSYTNTGGVTGFKNSGTIYGGQNSGGFTGKLISSGAIENIINTGAIQVDNAHGGGIIGEINTTEVGKSIHIKQCINAGAINATNPTKTLGGILGAVYGDHQLNVKIEGCRNYGQSTNDEFSGIVSAYRENPNTTNRISLYRNFGFGEGKQPIAVADTPIEGSSSEYITGNKNYYFTMDGTTPRGFGTGLIIEEVSGKYKATDGLAGGVTLENFPENPMGNPITNYLEMDNILKQQYDTK